MKTGIKRIEQTLRHLEQPLHTGMSGAVLPEQNASRSDRFATHHPPISFNISPTQSDKAAKTEPIAQPNPEFAIESGISSSSQLPKLALQDIHLPKPKTVALTPHRNAPNPALASSLLKDMLSIVTQWQEELSTIVQTIQNIYLEGPVLDAWLESLATPTQAETIAFRHADISQLLEFVEKLQAGKIQPDDLNSIEDYCTAQKSATYRLCGINPDGKLWHYPCPADQIPTISMAIARHHQLRQLRIRQVDLSNRLSHFSEDLVRLHSQLKD
jgi:hypothetical protein